MEPLSADQQKKAVLYAPKDLLWKLLDAEDGWLKLLGVLPEAYYNQFVSKLRLMGTEDPNQIKNMAKVYVQNKVKLDDLQEATAAAWNPTDLEEATSWLKEQGFLADPNIPKNLQASTRAIVAEAAAMPLATRKRLARAANGVKPKVGNPPDGASPEAEKCWNRVLRDPKRRKLISTPKGVEDQWALAHKFWLSECAKDGVPAYKGPAGSSSSSMHAENSIKRSFHELHNSLCHDGYTMSRPAARILRKLFDQLKQDGYVLGTWPTVRPKTPRGI